VSGNIICLEVFVYAFVQRGKKIGALGREANGVI
jgi:hypothetical protein